MFSLIRFNTWVVVGDVAAQHPVHQDGEFASGGGDRFGFTNPIGETPEV